MFPVKLYFRGKTKILVSTGMLLKKANLDEEFTTRYPFRKFKIKHEETAKRNLTLEQLRKLFSYPVEDFQIRYVDIFKLSFYLIGINLSDLLTLKKENIVNGRIEYHRMKTNRLYSIKIEPEAKEIIDKYAGENYLLNIMDACSNTRDFIRKMDKHMKNIGKVTRKGLGGKKTVESEFPTITSYYARHTWATLAAELDIPIETISMALGHALGSEVTNIYINFNRSKIDEANRKVIDYVLGY